MLKKISFIYCKCGVDSDRIRNLSHFEDPNNFLLLDLDPTVLTYHFYCNNNEKVVKGNVLDSLRSHYSSTTNNDGITFNSKPFNASIINI